VIPGLLHSAQASLHELGRSARALFWRGAFMAVAGLIGAAGFGFVVFAGYAALRSRLGPELSALLIGVTLIALAAALVWIAGSDRRQQAVKAVVQLPPIAPDPAPSQPAADPATMAVFTAAFVLGRNLADRRRT
jgi:hypothetical protein